MAHQEHNHGHHGHDHGHHNGHGHGHHEEKKGFWFSLVNDDGAGGFAVVWAVLAICCILWLITH